MDSAVPSRLRFLRRPQGLIALACLLIGGVFVSFHGWAWYHFAAGQHALKDHQNESALAHLKQCRRVWSRSTQALLLSARAERRLGQFDKAEQHLDECRKIAGSDISEEVAFEWALQRAALGDLRSVEGSLQSRLLNQPAEAPLIWEALADGYRRNYRMPEALRCLDTWLHFEPDNTHALFLRGEVHRQVGALSRAREEYRRVVELDPDHREARRHLARCLVQVGRYQEAAEYLDSLLHQTPDDPDLLTLKARSQYDLGQRQEGTALLDKALRAQPDYGPALRERGRLALAAEQFAEAEKWFRQAQQVLPYNYEVNWGLYQAMQSLGKTDQAKEQFAKAQQLKNAYERIHEIQTHEMTQRPADPALHAELGEMLVQTGQPDLGEYWLLSSLQIDPKLAAAHFALARLYAERGQTAQAEQHRREAERLAAVKDSDSD